MPKIIILLFALSISLFVTPSFTIASTPSSKLVDLHNRILDNPNDLDLLYTFIEAAIQEDAFEAAVGALESMLLTSSNQPRVNLELGVLYLRLNAPKTALNYLLNAKKLSAPGSDIATLADEYLEETNSEIATLTEETKKGDTLHQLTGIIGLGLRLQSNPVNSPESSEIVSGGYTFPKPENWKRKADTNALLFSGINHRYQLKPQVSLASEFVLAGTYFDKNDQLNYGSLELLSGPLFESFKNDSGHYEIRPHFVLRGAYLDGNLFENTTGLGLDLTFSPSKNTWLTPYLKARYQLRDITIKDFDDSGIAPLYSGDEHSLDLHYRTIITPGHLLKISLYGRQTDTKRNYLDLKKYIVDLSYSYEHNNFIFEKQPQMTLTPYIIRGIYKYDDPDPNIDPNTSRKDREWRIGLRYHIPFTQTQSLLLDMGHKTNKSNIINYDLNNNTAMIIYQKEF